MSSPSLYEALLTCETETEMRLFIKDLLSSKEITDAETRWAITNLFLSTGTTNQKEAQRLYEASGNHASEYLFHRAFHTLFDEGKGDGYRLAFQRLLKKKPSVSNANSHTPKK